jgi:DNA-binding transcriptional ArsR family regulator
MLTSQRKSIPNPPSAKPETASQDVTRVSVLAVTRALLRADECVCASQVAQVVGLEVDTVSQHLIALAQAGEIETNLELRAPDGDAILAVFKLGEPLPQEFAGDFTITPELITVSFSYPQRSYASDTLG